MTLVAAMLHGLAVNICNPLKRNGNVLQHVQHEGAP
jgi:hypothetical protein